MVSRAILLICLLFFVPPSPAQTAKAFLVVDVGTRKIILSQGANDKLPVGGLVKIATACVVDDWMEATNGDRNSFMIIPAEAVQQGINPLALQTGDRITIRDALFSALNAGDDVASFTLADYVGLQMWRRNGGKADSAIDFFISQMNALAGSRGMTRTRFVNPHGVDDRKGKGVSTAADIARLTLYAIQKPALNFIVRQTERDISIIRNGETQRYRIFNTNEMIEEDDIEGFKTGQTPRSGPCFVANARRPDEVIPLDDERKRRIPYHLVAVTLGSSQRFHHTRQLLDAAFFQYENWIKGVPTLTPDQILSIPD